MMKFYGASKDLSPPVAEALDDLEREALAANYRYTPPPAAECEGQLFAVDESLLKALQAINQHVREVAMNAQSHGQPEVRVYRSGLRQPLE